jgi:hypothetical protein
MDSTKLKLEDLLKSKDSVNPKEVREIILDWSLAMQEYFFAMNSNSVGAPAKKYFNQNSLEIVHLNLIIKSVELSPFLIFF